MGVRSGTKLDLAEELERVKRHINLAIFELTEASERLAEQRGTAGDPVKAPQESDLASLCISLELALADSVVCAQRLVESLASRRDTVANVA